MFTFAQKACYLRLDVKRQAEQLICANPYSVFDWEFKSSWKMTYFMQTQHFSLQALM